jgi:hypothetical protein
MGFKGRGGPYLKATKAAHKAGVSNFKRLSDRNQKFESNFKCSTLIVQIQIQMLG